MLATAMRAGRRTSQRRYEWTSSKVGVMRRTYYVEMQDAGWDAGFGNSTRCRISHLSSLTASSFCSKPLPPRHFVHPFHPPHRLDDLFEVREGFHPDHPRR